MGVNVDFIIMVGIIGDYNDFRTYKSKNHDDYLDDLKFNYLYNIKNIVFADYLPEGYIYDYDGMGGEYSFIGRRIFKSRDWNCYDGMYYKFLPSDIEIIRKEVIREFKNIKLEFNEDDVKLHIFTHFS